jgi:hypothetical protein
MSQLSKKQKELWNEISKILWEKWDPIGVYEKDSEWNDEYDGYVPHIFRLAFEGADSYKIASSLAATAHQNMGFELVKKSERDLHVANLIIQAKEAIIEQ